MAARGEELNTRITATDEASTVVDQVAKKVAALEDGEHEVEITAKDQASDDVAQLDARLDRLTAEERRVVLEARATQLEREVDRALKKLASVKAYDGAEVDLIIDAKDKATERLAEVRQRLERIDSTTVTATVDANTAPAEAKIEGVGDKLRELDGPVGDLIGKFDIMAGGGKAGMAGGVAAVAAGLLAAGEYAADLAIEVDNTARLTGGSVEETSKLLGVWREAGFEATDFQDVLLQMNGVLRDNPELAKQLGINLADGKDLGERFLEVVGQLGVKFDDASTRSQAASQLFGEEGVRQVNAVEAAFGDLATAVEDYNGKVFTPAEISKMREYKAEVGNVRREFQSMTAEVGSQTIPIVSDLLELMREGRTVVEEDIPGGSFIKKAFDKAALGPIVFALGELDTKLDELQGAAIDGAKAFDTAMGDLRTAAKDAYEDLANPEPVVSAAQIIQGEIDSATERVQRFGTDGVENMNDVADAAVDTADAVGGVEDAFADLRAEIANRTAHRQLATQFETVEETAIAAYEAAKTGSEDAEEKARQHQQALDDLRLKVIEYGDTITGLPDQFTTNILALIDEGKRAEAEAWIDRIGDGVTLPIKPQIINTGGGSSIYIDENGNVRPRHTGGLFQAGERIRVLPGEEIEMSMTGPGRVHSREDVARQASQQAGMSQRAVRPISFAGATFIGAPGPQYLRKWARQMEREMRGRL